MSVIFQYVAIIIALFGPKFGFLDSRLLLFPILVIFTHNKRVVFSKNHLYLIIVVFLLSLYSFALFLIFPSNPDFLRYIRAFISLLCLPFIINKNTSSESALEMSIYVLILHPIAIYLSMISPSIQILFAELSQCVAINPGRYSGLTAGYDMSGFLSISGFLICFFYYSNNNKVKYLIFSIFFYISVIFTSRTSIIVLLIVSLYLFFISITRSKFTFKKLLLSFTLMTLLTVTVYKYILPTFISTINIEVFEDLSDRGDIEAVNTYAKTDPYEMFKSFIILPKSNLGLIFGENIFPLSDSGYIQTINAIGIFGLIICFIFYSRLYSYSKSNNSIFNSLESNLSQVMKIILIITLVLCIKNQYMFTRGSFELVVLLFIILNLPETILLKI